MPLELETISRVFLRCRTYNTIRCIPRMVEIKVLFSNFMLYLIYYIFAQMMFTCFDKPVIYIIIEADVIPFNYNYPKGGGGDISDAIVLIYT